MKKLLPLVYFLLSMIILSSCKKEDTPLPVITFKNGVTYTGSDITLPSGSDFAIGINASKSSQNTPLKQFTLTKSLNGAEATIEYTKTLTGSETENYDYDYYASVSGSAGYRNKFSFYITDQNGITNMIYLVITIQ